MKKKIDFLFKFLIPSLFLFPLFKESFSSFVMILLTMNTILYSIYYKKKLKFDTHILFLSIPFGIVFINSLLYYKDFSGFEHIQHALFFLVTPFIFCNIPKEYFNNLNKLLLILKITCLIIVIVFITSFVIEKDLEYIFYESYNQSEFRRFVYSDLTLVKIHPAYFTTILILCNCDSLIKIIDYRKKYEFLFLIPFFLITILLLTKLNIVFMILLFLYFFSIRIKISNTKRTFLFVTYSVSVLLLFLYVPGLKSRFLELYNSYNKPPVGLAYDSTNIRQSIFDCSVDLIKKNYIEGVGFSNLQYNLNDCYSSNYNSKFFTDENFMTHNYYFYILLSSGLLGLLFFFFYLYKIILFAIKIKNFVFTIFLINIGLMCFVEDYLYRHYGVFYFNLILMSFIKNYENINKECA